MFGNQIQTLLLLLDLDLFVFIVVFLLASKSFCIVFWLLNAVTLRLGIVIKAIPMPNGYLSLIFNNLSNILSTVAESPFYDCKETRRDAAPAHFLVAKQHVKLTENANVLRSVIFAVTARNSAIDFFAKYSGCRRLPTSRVNLSNYSTLTLAFSSSPIRL